MKIIVGVLTLSLLAIAIAEDSKKGWSWGADSEDADHDTTGEDFIADETSYIPQIDNDNSTEVDEVIENILVSSRQGRNIEGLDEIYNDPNVKKALESGDDTESRNIIKERLCNLGLMQCEGKSYVAPEDLIYAQPVDIQPVGRPIPSIPVRGPPRAYGSPKPIPVGPPRKTGYSGPYRPGYGPPKPPGYGPPSEIIYGSSNSFNSFSNSFGGSSGPTYLSKPPGPVYNGPVIESDPYLFEKPIKPSFIKENKQFIGSASSVSGEVTPIQQHVHHHYHHGEDKEKQNLFVNNPIPVGAETHVHSSSSGLSNYQSNGFTPVGSGFGSTGGLYSSVKPVYEGSAPGFGSNAYKGQGSQSQNGIYNLGYAAGNNNYNPTSGVNSASFASNQFYKKELNTAAINSNSLGSGSYYGTNQYGNQFGYNGQESGRADGFDCVCVPFEQCPSQEVIGRKDDLFLPIDPRNLKKDIEAIPDEKVVITDGKGTMTIVRVPKMVESNSTESKLNETEVKKISKRETNDKASDSANKANIQPRQSGSDDDGIRGVFGKKVQPTFGVSFGLPNSGYGGYPLNPFGINPVVNPYGSSIGGNGLDLGLVSVNPLVSVQLTKNDYGEKVIKPLVNLHVTPNGNLIHKIGSFLHHKKEALFNGGYGGHGGFGGYGGYPPNFHSHYHYGPFRPPVPFHGPPRPPFIRPIPPPHFHGHGYAYSGAYREVDEYDEDDDVGPHEGPGPYSNEAVDFNSFSNPGDSFYGRSINDENSNNNPAVNNYAQNYNAYRVNDPPQTSQNNDGRNVKFPSSRRRRDTSKNDERISEQTPRNKAEKRQAFYGNSIQQCGPRQVCCRRSIAYKPQLQLQGQQLQLQGQQLQLQGQNRGQCGKRHSQGINGRIKNPAYVDGDSEFGEYPWQAAILKKDPKESVYVCGGTLIDHLHIVTAAHCVKTYTGFDLRVRLGEWDVNHDVEFFPYIERDVVSVHIHPQYYAGTLDNDLAILKMDHPVEWTKYPHISPACMPDKFTDYTGARCWTTGWGKDAFGDFGKYQNILKEVDVPIMSHHQCEAQLRQTRLGYQYQLNPGFICAGGEEGKDACKGDGGGPMVCERGGTWQLVGVVSWGIGCGQVNVPGVYVKVSHYLDWIAQITGRF